MMDKVTGIVIAILLGVLLLGLSVMFGAEIICKIGGGNYFCLLGSCECV